jgi:hypothetical protein
MDRKYTMEEQTEKRKRGHPPWTEEQKAARRELNAKKREERAIEERRQETAYQKRKRVKKGKRYRDCQAGPWSPEWRASNKKAWDDKFAERDKEYKQLIADNPHKTKHELGIPDYWKPRDGSSDGYYGVSLRNARVSINLPPINIKNPHEVEHRIDEYFDFCEMNNKPPNMVGLGNWLGVGVQTINRWKAGDWDVDTVGEVVQRALSVIEESLVSQVQDNPKAMVGGMFLLKSMFHYKEQQDIVIKASSKQDELSADEIAKRYLGDGKTVETEFVEDGDAGE